MRAEAYRQDRMVKYAPRTCLSCGSSFMSEGPWNRICNGCSERNSAYSYSRARGSSIGTREDEQTTFRPDDLSKEEASPSL